MTKAEPVTVSVKAGDPATNAFGAIDVRTGTGLLIVKVSGLDVPPPGAGVETVTDAVPAVAISAAVIATCKLVPDENQAGAIPHAQIEQARTKDRPPQRISAWVATARLEHAGVVRQLQSVLVAVCRCRGPTRERNLNFGRSDP